MDWEDDDFASQLVEYSEIETVSKDQPTPPKTILQYKQRIQSNNNISIFDADYSLDEPNGHSSALGKSKNRDNLNHDDVGIFKDEKVTFVLSGRGRGGRNHIFKPGEAHSNKTLNEEDEIRQQIRKIAPMGYSNEITESAVRAHKMAKVLEQNGTENISKNSSPISTKATLEEISSNLLRPVNENVLKNQSPISSGKSMSHTTSDPYSSEYFTSNDQNVSPSPSVSSNKTESDENQEDSSEEDCSTVATNRSEENGEVNNKGAIPKRPVPLSVMLQRSREEHKRRQLKYEEIATQKKIAEIIKQDLMEAEIRRKSLAENSSASSTSSRDDLPSWRQRTDSPPKYAWGQMKKRRDPRELNIDSFDDFPSLK